jgi:hypothetical protein
VQNLPGREEVSQRLNSDAKQIMEWILLLKIKLDRIYRIVRIFSFPVSGKNREYTIRFAEGILVILNRNILKL